LKALRTELAALREQRNQLCAKFLRKECGIPDFCVQLDEIGKKLADNCLFASIYDLSKLKPPRSILFRGRFEF